MADPLLEDKYPIKGLYQALAVAAMCLQEEADTRPWISDVVTALDFLAKKRVDEEIPTKETSSQDSGDNKPNELDDDDDDDDNDDNDDDDDDDNDDADNDDKDNDDDDDTKNKG